MSDSHVAVTPAAPVVARIRKPHRILRFVSSERALHWALAVPFVALYVTALAMVLAWGEAPPRDIRAFFSWAHRLFGICLVVLPPLVLTRGFREWRVHVENLREGWRWDRDDIRWLLLMPLAAIDKRITLPHQGKFNAAEKLNFMMVSTTYPLYVVTGILIWLPRVTFVPWLLHVAMAVVGLALVAGHIFMANGPVKAGDLLTPSATPGYAAKLVGSGPVIGKALEDYAFTVAGDSAIVAEELNKAAQEFDKIVENNLTLAEKTQEVLDNINQTIDSIRPLKQMKL